MNHKHFRLATFFAFLLAVLCLGGMAFCPSQASAGGKDFKSRQVFPAPVGGVTALAISSDGQTLAVAAGDKTVKIWDTEQGKELTTLRGYAEPVTAMAFSPDGKTLATLSKDKIVRVWNVRDGKDPIVHRNALAETGLLAIAEGKVLLAYVVSGREKQAGMMGTDWVEVRLLDLATGKHRTLTRASTPEGIPGISANLTLLAFTPDGKTVAVGSLDVGGGHNLILVDTVTQKQQQTLPVHRGGDYPSILAFSKDGKTLASAADGQITYWDLATAKVRGSSKGATGLKLIAADMRTLVAVDPQGAVKLWDRAMQPSAARLNGMKAALADIEKGVLKLKSFPLPDPAWHADYLKLLKKECGIVMENVTDMQHPQDEMTGYNDVMLVEIEHRFGSGILGKLGKQAQDDYLKRIGK